MLKPLNDRLLVLPDAPSEKTAGGILKPEISQERPVQGTVIAVGSKVLDRDLREGARVQYGKFSGAEIEIDGYEFVMLREDEIMGIDVPGGIPTKHIVEAVREQLEEQGIHLETERPKAMTPCEQLDAIDDVIAKAESPEPLECPHCFRKFNNSHMCMIAQQEVKYGELQEPAKL